MGAQAVLLCDHVKYNSAGTVEFLVDSKKNFYFLEMNTRLQVEHPVTEYITGVDLVEQMIRVAAGHKLIHKQSDIKIKGWAMESRVYAEDPTKMLPCIGNLEGYIPPRDLDGDLSVRVDTGVMEGSEISIYYDPMISKLITYGKDRNTAIEKMKHALDTYYIKGVTHNIPLLRDIVSHPRFQSGDINTKFIEQVYPDGFKTTELSAHEIKSLMAVATMMNDRIYQRSYEYLGTNESANPNAPAHTHTAKHPKKYVVLLGEEEQPAEVTYGTGSDCTVRVGDETITLSGEWRVHAPLMEAKINGKPITVQHLGSDSYMMQLGFKGSIYPVRILTETQRALYTHMPEPVELDTSLMVVSPMPGQIVAMNVKVGDTVGEGTVVAVVEAMKMQNSLRAGCSGKIISINAQPGENVSADDIIIEFEKAPDAAI